MQFYYYKVMCGPTKNYGRISGSPTQLLSISVEYVSIQSLTDLNLGAITKSNK